MREPPAPDADGGGEPADGGADGPGEPVDGGASGGTPAGDLLPQPRASITKAGPYSYGLFGKLVWTLLAIAGGFGLAAAARVISTFYGRPGLALVLLFVGVYTVFALLLLWGVWRPARVNPKD